MTTKLEKARAELALAKEIQGNSAKQVQQLQLTVRGMSGQVAAYKQTVDELMVANVNLRSSTLLLDDDLRTVRNELQGLRDYSGKLYEEKENLAKEIAKLNKPAKAEKEEESLDIAEDAVAA